jgi:hypothetical protein
MPTTRLRQALPLLLLAVAAAVVPATPAAAAWPAWVDHTPAAEGTDLSTLAVDPSQPSVIYAARQVGLGGMVKSVDGGRTWAAIDQGLLNDAVGVSFPGLLSVSGIAVRPQDSDVVYVGVRGSSELASRPATIFRSTSGGASWLPVGGPQAPDGTYPSVNGLAIDPRRARLMFAATSQGMFRSQDQGATWTALPQGLADDGGNLPSVLQVLIEPAHPDTVWALTSTHLYRSGDRGASWQPREVGLPASPRFGNLAFSAASGNAYLTVSSTGSPAVWQSSDRGASWQPTAGGVTSGGTVAVMPGAPDALLYTKFDSAAYSLDAGASWLPSSVPGGSQPGLGAASGDAWVTIGSGALRSEDHGATFVATNQGLPPAPGDLAVDPLSGNVFAGFGGRLYRSTDQGASFATPLAADHPILLFGTQPVSISGSSPATVDVIARADALTFYRSVDGGATFAARAADLSAFGQAFAPLTLTAIGGDPNRLICGEQGVPNSAGIGDGGIYRSLDGGLTWSKPYTPPDDGLFNFQPQTSATDPTDRGRVFVGVHWRHTSAFTEGALLRSHAAGAGFDVVLDGISFPQVSVGAAGSGGRRGVVYVGGGNLSTRQGLWRSLDHGATWERLAGGLPTDDGHFIAGVVADPAVRGRVWAVIDGLPWVSRNDGDTWVPVAVTGLPYGSRLTTNRPLQVDPSVPGERPARLWAATTLGLFSLNVETDP